MYICKRLNLVYKNISGKITPREAMEMSRSYNVLSSRMNLDNVLSSIIKDVDFSSFSKFEIHRVYNDIILSNYSSEQLIKSLLVDYFKEENVIAAFEIRTNESRLDFLRINGHSISYEIKSEVDNLIKLEKQISNYSELFEYNNVVVGSNHLKRIKELVPSEYGILIEKNGCLIEKRKARKNKLISAEKQLNLFTKKELNTYFECNIKQILDSYSKKKINKQFKEMLKDRYSKKWNYLCNNKNDILPIDYQYFYHHNISPQLIYGK